MREATFEFYLKKINAKKTSISLPLFSFTPAQLDVWLNKLDKHSNITSVGVLLEKFPYGQSDNFQLFLNYIEHNQTLHHLDLEDLQLSAEKIIKLFKSLENNHTIQTVNIQGNECPNECLEAMNALYDVNFSLLCILNPILLNEDGSVPSIMFEISDKEIFNLQLQRLNEVAFASLNSLDINTPKLRRYLKHNKIEHFILPLPDKLPEQIGPTCGYHALSTTTLLFNRANPACRFYPVRNEHPHIPGLLKMGKKAGFFKSGTITNYEELKTIVAQTDYSGHIEEYDQFNFTQRIQNKLREKVPVILGVDMVGRLEIGNKKGEFGHLITIIGYFKMLDQYHFLYSTSNAIGCASANELYASASQLEKKPNSTYLKINKRYYSYSEKTRDNLLTLVKEKEEIRNFYFIPEVPLTSFRNRFFVMQPKNHTSENLSMDNAISNPTLS